MGIMVVIGFVVAFGSIIIVCGYSYRVNQKRINDQPLFHSTGFDHEYAGRYGVTDHSDRASFVEPVDPIPDPPQSFQTPGDFPSEVEIVGSDGVAVSQNGDSILIEAGEDGQILATTAGGNQLEWMDGFGPSNLAPAQDIQNELESQQPSIDSLPREDPGQHGALWFDGSTVRVSGDDPTPIPDGPRILEL